MVNDGDVWNICVVKSVDEGVVTEEIIYMVLTSSEEEETASGFPQW